MTLTDKVTKNVIRKLLKNEDYRIEIVALINAEFLQFVIDFFKQIVEAKLQNKNISTDWYKAVFLCHDLPKNEIAINAGLNMKTISNMYNSGTKSIIIDAAEEHYDALYDNIEKLVESDPDLELLLTIKFKGVSVDLNISESLIVINTLAVKRAALRGGAWSTAGKQVEKLLMLTLCKVYSVNEQNYESKFKRDRSKDVDREIDFYLKNVDEKYRCEVKLMGQGNPESADAIFARRSNVFVADKLSDQNKKQAEQLNVNWVELHAVNGYKRFKKALEVLNIPHKDFTGDLDTKLDEVFKYLFNE
ncbi:CfrBI family restriction endonuclease [Breznakiellaceae bacterium SP9]